MVTALRCTGVHGKRTGSQVAKKTDLGKEFLDHRSKVKPFVVRAGEGAGGAGQ